MTKRYTPCRSCNGPADNYHMNGVSPGNKYDWYCESCFDRIQRKVSECATNRSRCGGSLVATPTETIDGSRVYVKNKVETSKCGGSLVAIHTLIANITNVNVR